MLSESKIACSLNTSALPREISLSSENLPGFPLQAEIPYKAYDNNGVLDLGLTLLDLRTVA